MDIPSNTVYEVLSENGIENIFHANSVITSCQCLRAKALLSRGNTERLNLRQTSQSSDEIDKRHSIWFDVFADSVDIHNRIKNINHYGPVLFVLSLDLIRRAYTGRIWVTKLNPTKWTGRSRTERWFQSKEDFEQNFSAGNFEQMIVFRHCGGALPFGSFLQKVILDDPDMELEGLDLFSVGFGALALAMSDAGLSAPIIRRQCRPRCECRQTYVGAEEEASDMFIPMPIES